MIGPNLKLLSDKRQNVLPVLKKLVKIEKNIEMFHSMFCQD